MAYEYAGGAGSFDFDQHYTAGGHDTRILPRCDLDLQTGRIDVTDPVWGQETIGDWEGDEIFVELYQHPVFQRLKGIEQLTLPKHYTTMPDTFDMTRWEHAWGSVVLVRQLLRQAETEGQQFTPREKLLYQLRTFVSDAAHTAFSHLGDWLLQSPGGPEDAHDQRLPRFLEVTGVNDILRRYGFDPAEVIFPRGIKDFVECAAPELCDDRVDYGARQITRCVAPAGSAYWPGAFKLDENRQLVMPSQRLAREFGAGFGLLATENWGHPVQRLQLHLFGELVKAALVEDDVPVISRYAELHITDRLYAIDDLVVARTRQFGPLNNYLHALLLDTGRAQRRVYAWGRLAVIRQFMSRVRDGQVPAVLPDPLQTDDWHTQYAGAQPPNIELIPAAAPEDVSGFGEQPHTLDVFLGPLKTRAVDPPIMDVHGRVHPLSEADDEYAAIYQRVRELQARTMVARIHLAPAVVQSLRHGITEVNKRWHDALAEPLLEASTQSLAAAVGEIGMLAAATNWHLGHVT